jgi:hypothetical protein
MSIYQECRGYLKLNALQNTDIRWADGAWIWVLQMMYVYLLKSTRRQDKPCFSTYAIKSEP